MLSVGIIHFGHIGFYGLACAGSQMARNLTGLSSIDLVYSVSQNQTICLVLRLVPHSTVVGGECTQAHL